jgi:hypothetical protein
MASKSLGVAIFLAVPFFLATLSAASTRPLLLIQPSRLAELKAVEPDNPEARRLTKLLAEADAAMELPTITITENPNLQASGDPHDYFSTAPYYWPNPNTPDGMPYIRKDGERNPDRAKLSDQEPMLQMLRAAEVLAIVYHITGQEKYATSAARLLRGFFLDPKTRMNPNLNHSQGVPGGVAGRSYGVIDTLLFIKLPDILTLLDPSTAWTSKDREGFSTWCAEFADWLCKNPLAVEEKAAINNHGVTYDLQLAAVLLAAGKEDKARDILKTSLPSRMDSQIKPDGSQPEELARTTSWNYSCFNLRYLAKAAAMARALDIDLWHHVAPDGSGSLRAAMLYLVPYLKEPQLWKAPQIKKLEPSEARSWLGVGAAIYPDTAIQEAAHSFAPPERLDLIEWLSIPLNPPATNP